MPLRKPRRESALWDTARLGDGIVNVRLVTNLMDRLTPHDTLVGRSAHVHRICHLLVDSPTCPLLHQRTYSRTI